MYKNDDNDDKPGNNDDNDNKPGNNGNKPGNKDNNNNPVKMIIRITNSVIRIMIINRLIMIMNLIK